MTEDDMQIIERIKNFSHDQNLPIENTLDKDNAWISKNFEIDRRDTSKLMKKYRDGICKEPFLTLNTLSTLMKNFGKIKGNDGVLMQGLATKIFCEKFEEIQGITIEECISNLKKLESEVKFLHVVDETSPMFICVNSAQALENILSYLYQQNNDIQCDLVLSEELCSNKFEILKQKINRSVKNHIDRNELYNDKLNLTYYTSKKSILLNMIGLGVETENKNCGYVYDETACYELSSWGQNFAYKEYKNENNLVFLGTSQFLDAILDINVE